MLPPPPKSTTSLSSSNSTTGTFQYCSVILLYIIPLEKYPYLATPPPSAAMLGGVNDAGCHDDDQEGSAIWGVVV